MKHGAGHKLVQCQQVRQDPPYGAVVPSEEANQEMLVELIGRPRVENVHAEDALAGVGAIEADPIGVEGLREVLVRLERDADIGEPRPALEGIDWIVVNRRADPAPLLNSSQSNTCIVPKKLMS